MTVSEIIDNYNIDRPNDVDDARKVTMVRQLEMIIFNEIISTHVLDEDLKAKFTDFMNDDESENIIVVENASDLDSRRYFEEFGMYSEVFAGEPYSDVYKHFIDQKISDSQNEAKRYNAATTMYNSAYTTFRDYWNRTHRSISKYITNAHHDLI